MTWVKAKIGERENDAIEALQERHDCNKTEAAAKLLRIGTVAHENDHLPWGP